MSAESPLLALLERWRDRPDPVLADAIDVVSAGERRSPFTGSLTAQLAAAIEAIDHHEDASLPSILETLAAQRSIAQATVIAQHLVDHWPPDPRFTPVMQAWLQNAPWTSSGSLKVWRRLFKLLERSQDQRLLLLFAELDPEQAFPGQASLDIRSRIDRLLRSTYPQPSGSPAETEAWTAILAGAKAAAARRQTQRAQAEAFLQQIHADPHDLDLRRVYADALCEQGDPRGTFIGLQLLELEGTLDSKGRTAMNRLLRDHEASWLGPVHAVLLKGERTWSGGFLTRAVAKPKSKAVVDAALGHPAWKLVEAIELRASWGTGYRGFELISHPGTPNLQRISGLTDGRELIGVLTNPHGPPIRAVGLASTEWHTVEPGPRNPPLRITALDELTITPAWVGWMEWFQRNLTVKHAHFTREIFRMDPLDTLALFEQLGSGWAERWTVELVQGADPAFRIEGDRSGARSATMANVRLSDPALAVARVFLALLPDHGIDTVSTEHPEQAFPVLGIEWSRLQ